MQSFIEIDPKLRL